MPVSPPTGVSAPLSGETDRPTRLRVTRAPSDVLRLVVATVALVVFVLLGVLFGDAIVHFVNWLLVGLRALPTALVVVVAGAAQVAAVVLVIVGLVATVRIRSWRLLVSTL